MSSHQLDEERIFHLARQQPNADARSEYLDQVCAGDQALRERVEELLRVHEQEQSFLKSNGDPPPTEAMGELSIASGQQIGRYKLLQKIGEGGFGVVFMAEQSRPVQRKVALKVIKPGMDSQAVVARFEAERQALAIMDHPNIARVFDGGATEGGRPYFVMELVKGVPITEYCDKNELSTEQRLKLFTTVCQAVQHAHQKGIIHRDLKPSNVLVTLADGEPVVKVIDFGVAKATSQQLTEKTLFTAYGQMVGTPQYMSPEQAEMSCLDVDTRSDVYSLGVLLYELLTGTTPLEAERLRTAGYAEMQRLIREEEPPKPSTRLSTSGDKLTILAKHRKVTPEKLKSQVRGDLDWIVMKALAKERSRRYDSANRFAEDVERYLDCDVVEARPPSASYRVTKFIRRNRSMVSVALLLAIVLVTTTVIASMGWLRAAQKERELRTMLGDLQGQVIERALIYAMAGELHEDHFVLREAKAANVPDDWLLALHGIALVHQGENEDAVRVLRQAKTDNLAARAMLSFALYHTGRWEEWSQVVGELMDAQPRHEYAEFDELCLGYAFFYVDYDLSAGMLKRVLGRHPTWIVPRGILASAMSHSAMDHPTEGQLRAEEAIREIEFVWRFSGDNPFVLLHSLGVYNQTRRVLGPNAELDQRGLELAAKLGEYPEYSVGNLVRAIYYDQLGHFDEAKKSWNDTLEYGRGTICFWPMAELARTGEFDRIRQHQSREIEAQIARAYALALSPDEADRIAARSVYVELKGQTDSWFMRYLIVQIPLLLKDPDEAKRQCRSWTSADTASLEILTPFKLERHSIMWLAGRSLEQEWNLDSADPVERFFSNYQVALVAYANGDLEESVRLLGDCPSALHSGFLKWWAQTFLECFSRQMTLSQEES